MKRILRLKKLYLIILTMLFFLIMQPGKVQGAVNYALDKKSVILSTDTFSYTGRVQKPKVKVQYKGKVLKKDKDYVLKWYGECSDVGSYRIDVKGKGNYKGTVRVYFKIIPQTTEFRSVVSLEGKAGLKVSWKKQLTQTKGYQIQYSTNKKMENAKILTVADRNLSSISLGKLRQGTLYYLRIRTYSVVKGKNYYSKWSRLRSCRTASETQAVVTPTPVPELSFKRGSQSETLEVGKNLRLETTNRIKSVDVSDTEVLYQYTEITNSSVDFYCAEPGKVVITITDIYGQSIKTDVTVTQKLKQKNYGEVTVTSVKKDLSLPYPVVETISYNKYSFAAYFLGTFSPDDPYEGFEVQLSKDKTFMTGIKETYVNTTLGNEKYGYAYISFNGSGSGNTYYVRTRSYKILGTVKVTGAWSDVTKIDVPLNDLLSGKPKYSYELYYLDKNTTDLYTKCGRVVYLKTDNPDPNTISLSCDGVHFMTPLGNWRDFYSDILFLKESDEGPRLQKVDGGYVAYWEFEQAGTFHVEVREYSLKGYKVAGNAVIHVKDYNSEKETWMKDVIAMATTPDMDSFEKMSAVCNYLTGKIKFKYLTNDGNKVLSLAAEPNAPYFRTYRWDSMISPTELCDFAKLIGGFDDIHNCYYDYPRGSDGWKKWHSYAKLTIGNDSRYYSVCPLSSTGNVGEVKMIDFSHTENFRKII